MNGRPLPIEHGFPVRTIVPGLYGYVSATKWVVDLEVSTFAKAVGYWTDQGLVGRGAGQDRLAHRRAALRRRRRRRRGHLRRRRLAPAHRHRRAWRCRSTGARGRRAELGEVPSVDTWVQWAVTLDVARGRPRGAGARDRQGRRDPDQRRRAPRPGRLDRAAHDRDQRVLTPPGRSAVADDVRRPAGRGDPDPLELRAVVDAAHLGVGGAGRVVDDDVAVGLEADDDQQVAVARRDRRAGRAGCDRTRSRR